MTLRRFSQCLALALAALTWWVMVSQPGVVEPEFAGVIYVGVGLLVAVVFGVLYAALRVSTWGRTVYWSGQPGTRQVRRVGLMIGAMLVLQLAAGRLLDVFGLLDPLSSTAIALLIGTMVPAAFLEFGGVSWPKRLRSASILTLLVGGVLGLGAATAWSWNVVSVSPHEPVISPIAAVGVRLLVLVVAATSEEVVFRVLLLTALLHLPVSRLQAVFLSGVAFGLMHAPLALVQPVANADWALLALAAPDYAPVFLLQMLGGLVLGVLWLRTGSIVLIAMTHAVLNIGLTLIHGL
jgi:membrane protease YdiL (CAAX protease family)